jgi:diacylglycerol kinase (ATP)
VRQEAITLGLAISLGFFISPGPAWYVAMIGVLLVLLAVELLNTAIEKLSDHVTPEHHVEIGIIKDAASAAVFCLLWSQSLYGSWRFRCVSDFLEA